MRHRGFLVAGLAVFALGAQIVAVPSHAIAVDRGAAYEELAEMAEARMRQASVPGLSIVIVDDRGVLWSRGFGVTAPDGGASEDSFVDDEDVTWHHHHVWRAPLADIRDGENAHLDLSA